LYPKILLSRKFGVECGINDCASLIYLLPSSIFSAPSLPFLDFRKFTLAYRKFRIRFVARSNLGECGIHALAQVRYTRSLPLLILFFENSKIRSQYRKFGVKGGLGQVRHIHSLRLSHFSKISKIRSPYRNFGVKFVTRRNFGECGIQGGEALAQARCISSSSNPILYIFENFENFENSVSRRKFGVKGVEYGIPALCKFDIYTPLPLYFPLRLSHFSKISKTRSRIP
jgi:hypothetical protein